MSDELEFDQAVGLIYDAAVAPEIFPAALMHLTKWLDGDTCHLVGWQGSYGEPFLSVSAGLDAAVGPNYAAHYAAIDPRRQLALERHVPGELLLCHEHFDKRFVSQNEFFQDYLLPIGIHHMLGTTLVKDSTHLVQFAFHRYVGHAHFSEREIVLARRLMPHLQRALQIMIRAQRSQSESVFNQAAAKATPFAMFALSSLGEILHANFLGERLLRSGSCVRQLAGRLTTNDPNRNAELRAALQQVMANGRPINLNLGGRGDAEHCCLTVMRLPSAGDLDIISSKAAMLCIVTENSGYRIATARQLIDLFNLSPAEARLARAMAQGESLDEYAAHQGLKRTTVKSQLKNALSKMELDNQKSLIRMILRLPAVRE